MDRILRGAGPLRKLPSSRGEAAEQVAAVFLERKGLKVLARNFRVRGGEIDLVCEENAGFVFVEVRLRTHQAFGGAGASVDGRKQVRLILAARHWLAAHGERACRFDCVLMDRLDESGVNWIRNAFTAD
jgi:putative endonuclease